LDFVRCGFEFYIPLKKNMNPNLYRLHKIHIIESGLNEEKLKHSAMIKK